MIDANIFPKLIEILATGEKSTRNEIAWAICNSTSGGTPEQIRYLVKLRIIPPLCDLLTLVDNEKVEIVEVALKSLYNILKLGQQNGNCNPYAFEISECGGLTIIENLTRHQKENIAQKAALIIETFFAQEKDTNIITQV